MSHDTDTPVLDPDTIPDPDRDSTSMPAPTDSAASVQRGPTLDPALLDIADNVRENFRLEDHPDVTESIREHGVRSPIKVIRMPDGRLVVRDGQVRTLTALAFAQTEVPVWVTDFDPSVDAAEAEIERITEQITVNDRRIPLTDSDRAKGIAQMLDLGASVTQVARALQTKRDDIKRAGKIGASDTARNLVDEGQYDLEQAAIIAEYDNLGDTDAVERLMRANRSWFSYEANRIAHDRAEARAYLTAALPYAEAGLGILTDYPDLGYYTDKAPLIVAAELVDADGTAVDISHIHAHPGFWLVWLEIGEDMVWVEVDTGALVDPDTVDWDTRDHPDTEPAEGLRHAREVEQREQVLAEYFLPRDQLDAAGLFERETTDSDDITAEDTDSGDTHGVGESGGGGDELAAGRRAAAQAEAERREDERLARRRVRELNKQGEAAKTTRVEFVTALLARKTPPAQAAVFLAHALVAHSGLLGEYHAFSSALKLLGLSGFGSREELIATIETAKPARCQVIVLALVLGAYENRAEKDLWRYADRGVRLYLEFLRTLGHQLVPVELAALGEINSDDIDIDNPTATTESTTQQPEAA
ncbi:ParB/RepB/Spo0J family partition protein [Nocardia bhagyanarayanae]|uniref:ParB family chromosome partitioning protein n=1 Tax=Nocardia bhagyanarayanae TaxID=1215925 RepID=A0A543FFT9_9NOCA|nr:ParB N-terminal domain-containing protein [Nocardia bhagyanarayanae]TQM32729.1 ParB family chromosome partitioning protein [Nocardia bhagyanarayanae]